MKLSQIKQLVFISVCAMSIQVLMLGSTSVAQETAKSSEEKESNDEKLPTPSQVIDRHVGACGGYEVIESITNFHYISSGTHDSRTFQYETYRTDGKYWSTYQYPTATNLYRGATDDQVWQFYEGGNAKAFEGEERLEYLRQIRYVMPSTKWFDTYKKIEVDGIESVRDRDAYKLSFYHKDGSSLQKYFDVETFMCVRNVATEEYGKKKQHVIRDSFDFRKVGECTLAFQKRVSYDGGRIHEYKIEEFEFDVKIPGARFKMPENIARDIAFKTKEKLRVVKPDAPAVAEEKAVGALKVKDAANAEVAPEVKDASKAEAAETIEEIMRRLSRKKHE